MIVKKHLGILGCTPTARLFPNNKHLYCKNCKSTPDHLSEKEYFVPLKWYQWSRYGETAIWKICSDCYTPLEVRS